MQRRCVGGVIYGQGGGEYNVEKLRLIIYSASQQVGRERERENLCCMHKVNELRPFHLLYNFCLVFQMTKPVQCSTSVLVSPPSSSADHMN